MPCPRYLLILRNAHIRTSDTLIPCFLNALSQNNCFWFENCNILGRIKYEEKEVFREWATVVSRLPTLLFKHFSVGFFGHPVGEKIRL